MPCSGRVCARGKGGYKMPSIPNKLYFRIGEVSKLIGVEPYVLRYWESEFPEIKPSKSKSGQRLYKRRDVELLLQIKELLYEERYTINGARKRLKDWSRGEGRELDVAEIKESPKERQLDAFSFEDEGPGERGDTERAHHVPPGGVKVLKKIRRDLESLLTLVKE